MSLTRPMIQKVLDNFAQKVVKAARLNVGATRTITYNDGKKARRRISNSGQLLNSIGYSLSVKQNRDAQGRFQSGNEIRLSFEMEDYGQYLDEGVDGTKYKVKEGTRFGYTKKQPPLKDIRAWMKQRNFRLRDLKTNSFIPTTESGLQGAAYAISRKIKERGLPRTAFLQTPFNLEFDQLPPELLDALGDDFLNAIK
jgi:hypothetical protein